MNTFYKKILKLKICVAKKIELLIKTFIIAYDKIELHDRKIEIENN